jgi:hypothetical protein
VSERAGALSAIALAAALVSGCVHGRYSEGQPLELSQLERVKPGETTKSEILQWFGSPQSYADPTLLEEAQTQLGLTLGPVVDLPYADVLVYRATEGRLRAIVLLLFNHIDLRVASDTLVFFFDDQDRVLYYGVREGTRALR